MVKRYDVNSVRSPGGRYSHVGEVGPGGRLFHLAGQTGTAPDGTTPEGIEAQSRVVYQNIASVLKECGMGLEDLVKLTIFHTDPANIEAWRNVQKEALGNIAPASTLLVVSRLARPEYLIEVEAIAAID